jgi:hypothetical protein
MATWFHLKRLVVGFTRGARVSEGVVSEGVSAIRLTLSSGWSMEEARDQFRVAALALPARKWSNN